MHPLNTHLVDFEFHRIAYSNCIYNYFKMKHVHMSYFRVFTIQTSNFN